MASLGPTSVLTPDEIDVCSKDPGFPVDATVAGRTDALVAVYVGSLSWREALRSGLRISGEGACLPHLERRLRLDKAIGRDMPIVPAKTETAMTSEAEAIRFSTGAELVSALLDVPPKARAGYVLAHGAGAGMAHPFLAAVASGLAERGIATFRYQFPYMERKSGRPDSPKVAEAAVRAAVVEAGRHLKKLPLIAGGKSFGGRMTSQAQAAEPL
ncbi:MAG: alpha/beta family hydrolase, partial [Bauldia sp.]